MDPLAGPVERLAWELRQIRERAGRPSYRELARRAHFSRSTLAEAAAGTRLPTLEATVAYAVACGGDRAEWEQRWRLAAEQAEWSRWRCPYPGALPLGADDAELFSGRDRLLDELLEAVRGSSLTAVSGASGSGKSSLLRAGLAARLTADGIPVTLLTPGAHPVPALRAVDAGTSAVVIVDQFEEVFTRCADDRERAGFLDALSAMAAAEDGPRLVLGIRADFVGHCTAHPSLATALRAGVHLQVGPVTERELRAIVTEPAERVGLSVDPELVTTVLVEASDQMGALPLVAQALRETWSRQEDGTLRLADHQAAGGVTGAIARIAENLHADLATGRRHLLQAVLLRLTAPGDGTPDIRRKIERDELTGIGAPGEVAAVLDRLAAARLVVVDRDTVDLAHEGIIHCWPRLREWLTADRERLLRHRRLTLDAAEWSRNGRGEDYLYRGDRLAAWDDEGVPPLNELERTFLALSRAHASAGRARGRRRTRLAFGALSLTAVAVAALTALALVQMGNADTERDRSTSVRLAAEARRQLQQDPELALLLAIEAYETEATRESDLVLRQATADARLRGSQPSGLDRAEGMTATPDGRRIAIWGSGGSAGGLVIWTFDDSAPRRIDYAFPPDRTRRIRSAAFSHDGRRLATGSSSGEVALWDLEAAGSPTVLGTVEGGVHGVSVSRDGRVASAHDDGVRIWDSGTGEGAIKFRPPGRAARSVAFSPTGRLLATGGIGSPLHLWEMTGDRPRSRRAAARGGPAQVAVSPHGPWVATVEDDVARVWDGLERPDGDWTPQAELDDHAPRLNGLVFSPGGDRLATYGADGVIRVWTTGSDVDPLVLRAPRLDWRGAAFAPDGKSLVGIDAGGSLRLWDASAGDPAPSEGRLLALSSDAATLAVSRSAGSILRAREIRIDVWTTAGTTKPTEVRGERDSGFLVALSPDGRRMAGVGRAGTLSLWDLAASGAPAATPAAFPGPPASLVFSSDGKRLAAGGHRTEPRVWQVPATGNLTPVTGWETQPSARADGDVALSPDGTLLADARDDHTVLLWDLAHKGEPRVLRGHQDDITGLAFSPDGGRLAAAAADGAIRLWDTGGRGEPVAVLRGAENRVRKVRFSPDGGWLVTNEPAGPLRLWRTTGGEPLELTGWGASGGLAAFNPDGTRIVRGLSPPLIIGRDLSTGLGGKLVRIRACEVCGPGARVLELARTRRTRELTPEERRNHLGRPR
ncbi:nSTAND1 domain-containing NTPase [Actinomadura sp. 3N407]|uniref:nSTAND1 domain-containing NTPase n=1 Tax=Actinomadura sp. 3N407 TaxID=3457423 RepID=UPI003FCE771B